MGFHHIGQDGLEFLTSGDLPASATKSAGITGVTYCVQTNKLLKSQIKLASKCCCCDFASFFFTILNFCRVSVFVAIPNTDEDDMVSASGSCRVC